VEGLDLAYKESYNDDHPKLNFSKHQIMTEYKTLFTKYVVLLKTQPMVSKKMANLFLGLIEENVYSNLKMSDCFNSRLFQWYSKTSCNL
jgi:hypothetical protein